MFEKKESLRPLADRVVVKREAPTTASPGGILLPDTAKDKPVRGTVTAVGLGKWSDGLMHFTTAVPPAGVRLPMAVKVGDVVLFETYAGTEVQINGEDLVILTESQILGVVQRK